MRLYRQPAAPADKVSDDLAAKFENDASKYWDMFYKRNAAKFFKDRHYFDKEFPELLQGQLTVLEVGCGVGNTVFPLLDINPQLTVYACDFSPRAVQLVQEHPEYNSGRVTAFVADITKDQLSQQLHGPCVDYCSMVFVLSAVAPDKMPQAIRNVASVLKPGTGRILFRDYAVGDLAQTRLEDGNGVKFIRDNFYVRGDGTCCYYYAQNGLRALFASEGFVCESMVVHARIIENRKLDVKMPRRWIQAVFRWGPDEVAAADRQAAQQQWQQQQQQQQQLNGHPEKKQRVEQVPVTGSRSSSSSGCSSNCDHAHVQCAGRNWRVATDAADGSTNLAEQLQPMAAELDQLLCQQQQLQQQQQQQPPHHVPALGVLGRHCLFLPPWAALQQQQRDQQRSIAEGAQHCHYQLLHSPGAASLILPPSSSSGSNSSSSSSSSNLYLQGAAAALFALVVAWLGARRVYVLVPGSGAYESGFSAMLHVNESNIVCERVRQRRCDCGDKRQLQKLQRELRGQPLDVIAGNGQAVYQDSTQGSVDLQSSSAAAESAAAQAAGSSAGLFGPHDGVQHPSAQEAIQDLQAMVQCLMSSSL